jgi:filamentous hemagglutinin family protein
MNHIYRSIWNDKTNTFVAVPENAKSAGKKSSIGATAGNAESASFALKLLAISLMLSFATGSYAQPLGGVVTAGSASIGSVAGSTTITQSTQNAAINWQSFNIAPGEGVQFVQPNSNSVALNRVVGADPSSILGNLSANGKVFLVNPNGILFGTGAQVNVGGLVASTLNISDSDFMAGRYNFTGSGGTVLNQGSINADGGYVALLGADVGNNGVITAKLGTVSLAAGNAITLDVAGDGLLNVMVNQGAMNALVQNGGMIQADGGQVLLTAQAAGNLLSGAVNNTGVIQAQTIENHNGTIKLMGDMQSGTVNVAGRLDASAPNGGDGGFIETSAAHVKVADNAIVTAQSAQGKSGSWLIDPNDVTIQAAGANTNVTASPNFTSTNDNAIVTTASIETALNAGTSVVVTTGTGGTNAQAGDITVIDPLTWTAVTGPILTLNAARDVTVNAAITATTGSFAATAGRNVNVNAATKTTTGNLTFTAAGDVNLAAATTITTGNLTAVAGGNVNVSAASTITTGNMVFYGDNDGTGPGAAAGTVSITCGINCLTITTGTLQIRFNPVSYATTPAEITAYGTHLTGAGVLDAKAWVFGKGDNKIYDGTTAATVSGLKPDLGGTAPAAAIGVVSNANFDTRNVGTNKLITYNSTFANATYDLFAPFGIAAGTYTTHANITPLALTGLIATGNSAYGAALVPGAASLLGIIGSDVVTPSVVTITPDVVSTSGHLTAGSHSGIESVTTTLGGADAANYTFAGTTGNYTVSQLGITGSITAANKVYDANNSASILTRTLSGAIGGDTVSYTGGTATFSDKNVANGKTVTGTGLSLTGTDAGNYTVNPTASTTANITPAPLTLQANDNTKLYGQTFTPLSTAFTIPVPPVTGETVTSVAETSTGSAQTASVAGSTYPIVITSGSATGTGGFVATNYAINYVNGALTVTPAPLTVTANNNTKVYGQTFTPAGTAFTTTALQNGETVGSVTEVSPAGTPPTAAVPGSYAIIPGSATGGTFTPTNYIINYVNGALTVTPAPLTVTANNNTKVYGQTFTPAGTAFTTTALQNGETVGSVTEVSPAGTPPTAAVPGPYAIIPGSATGGTFTPTNYIINYVNGVLTITPLALTGSITAADKVYDTTTAAVIAGRTVVGVLSGDSVTYTGGTATFDTPAVGTSKTVTGTGLGLSGSDAGNYTVNPIAVTTANITPVVPVVPPVVVPPVVVPPIVVPPVVVPPVVVPPVVVPPVVTPLVVTPLVEVPPVETPTNELPPVVGPLTPPIVVLIRTPDQLLSVAPPVVIPPVADIPPVAVPPVEVQPEYYVPPYRKPKQDRN